MGYNNWTKLSLVAIMKQLSVAVGGDTSSWHYPGKAIACHTGSHRCEMIYSVIPFACVLAVDRTARWVRSSEYSPVAACCRVLNGETAFFTAPVAPASDSLITASICVWRQIESKLFVSCRAARLQCNLCFTIRCMPSKTLWMSWYSVGL